MREHFLNTRWFVGVLIWGFALTAAAAEGIAYGAPSALAHPALPSSGPEDWFAAVCKVGTFSNGGTALRNASGEAACQSSQQQGPLWIGQYNSVYLAQNDAARIPFASAIGTDSGGTVWLFIAVGGRTGNALAPLRQFGFTLAP